MILWKYFRAFAISFPPEKQHASRELFEFSDGKQLPAKLLTGAVLIRFMEFSREWARIVHGAPGVLTLIRIADNE